MKKLEPYPIASALFFIFAVLYLVCIGVELLLSSLGIVGFWHMHKIWEAVLPWFNGLDSLSIVIGLLEVSVGSYFIGYIIVPLYNFLAKKRLSKHKIEIKPIIIRFKTLFFTFAAYTSILFTLCLIYDLFVPAGYKMTILWKTLLPGFISPTFPNYLFGLLDILIYSAYTAFIFSKTLNNYEKSELKKLEGNNLSQEVESQIKFNELKGTKTTYNGKKYDEKYFGIAAGVFAVIVFLLAIIKLIFSGENNPTIFKPFIPFFNSLNAFAALGGIVVSFLWGSILGYFFILIYHFFDRRTAKQNQN